MNEEVREKMVLAFENAVLVAGAQDYEAGVRQASKLIEFIQDGVQSIQTKDGLRKMLDSWLPMSKSEEKVALLALKLLPQLLRIGLKGAAKKAETTLPALPGGRPRAVSADKTQEALNHVSELHRKGCTFKVAKDRASMKYGLSQRTIERMWLNRESIQEVEPTVDDVLRFISKGELPSG